MRETHTPNSARHRGASTAILISIAVLVAAPSASAQPPAQVPLSGFLTDPSGTPVDGNTTFDFSLYEAETGGTSVYTESHLLDVDQGRWDAALGSSTPLDLALFGDFTEVWLGVTVDGGTEMPRVQMATVPYAALAARALDCDQLGGVPASSWQARVASTCADGTAVIGLQQDGSPMCASFGSPVVAGTGLASTSLSGDTVLSVDEGVFQRRVQTECPSFEMMIGINMDGSPICTPVHQRIVTRGISRALLDNGAVDQVVIANDGVWSHNIRDGSVGTADLALGAVDESIASLPVGYAVGGGEIASGGGTFMVSQSLTVANTARCMVSMHANAVNLGATQRDLTSAGVALAIDGPSGASTFGGARILGHQTGVTTGADITTVLQVPAGTTTFGCAVSVPSPDLIGANLTCTATWLCT